MGMSYPGGVEIRGRVTPEFSQILTPEAVATIIAYLQPARVKDKDVQREVEWFSEELVKAVGGDAELNRLVDEIGL